MITNTRGIVFRTIKYSETSVISKIYTEKFGMQSYIVNGVRSSKSKMKASQFQIMSMLDMEVYYHEHRNINRIKELRSYYSFTSLLFNPLKSAVGLFMIEVLNKCIHEEEQNEQVFRFISEKLISIDKLQHLSPDYLIKFLLELAALLGFTPHGNYSDETSFFDLKEGHFISAIPNHQHFLNEQLSEIFSKLVLELKTELTVSVRRKLLEALLEYFQLHVPNFSKPKSLAVLEEVFR
ncbi:MAG: DNA repair protein RecO [Chitinophagales bacterium]|nr:DNA repair protein RecO [Chitinophagales bacterium]